MSLFFIQKRVADRGRGSRGWLRSGWLVVVAVGWGLVGVAWAGGFEVDPYFSSDMVLQRDARVEVRGGGVAAGLEVRGVLRDQAVVTTAAADGSWRLAWGPQSAGGPVTISISAGGEAIDLERVLFGDVWLCAGQSNVNFPTRMSPPVRQWFLEQPPSATQTVRFLAMEVQQLDQPARHPALRPPGVWRRPDEKNIANLSAVGLVFGVHLNQQLGVPVGLVHCAKGGSVIEAWMAPHTVRAVGGVEPALSGGLIPHSSLYHGMLAPLRGRSFAGVLWYQGESNGGDPASYRDLLPAFIDDVRWLVDQPDLPFVVVQLPSFGKHNWFTPEDGWAWLREAQSEAVDQTPSAVLVPAYDLGEFADVHPVDKRQIGQRSVLAAEAIRRDEADATFAPRIVEALAAESQMILRVDSASGGLASQAVEMMHAKGQPAADGAAYTANAARVVGFEISGEDQRFVSAEAVLDGETIRVSSPEVPTPVAVRYAWSNFTLANVVDGRGVPLRPYRSDDWPVPEALAPWRPEAWGGVAPSGEPGRVTVRHAASSRPLPEDGQRGVLAVPTDEQPKVDIGLRAPASFRDLPDDGRGVVVNLLICDDRTGPVEVRYDAHDEAFRLNDQTPPGAYKLARPIQMTGFYGWRVVSMTFDDARFSGRCGGSDLRLFVNRRFAGPLRIAGVWFDHAPETER